MENKLRFRKADIGDRKYFLRTYNEESTRYQFESDKILYKHWYKTIISRVSSIWFVIELNDLRVGLFNTFMRNDKPHWGICIQKEYRRKGIASLAIKEYLKVLDEKLIDSYIDCFDDNPALKLYKSLGYKETGEVKIIRDRNFIELKRDYIITK